MSTSIAYTVDQMVCSVLVSSLCEDMDAKDRRVREIIAQIPLKIPTPIMRKIILEFTAGLNHESTKEVDTAIDAIDKAISASHVSIVNSFLQKAKITVAMMTEPPARSAAEAHEITKAASRCLKKSMEDHTAVEAKLRVARRALRDVVIERCYTGVEMLRDDFDSAVDKAFGVPDGAKLDRDTKSQIYLALGKHRFQKADTTAGRRGGPRPRRHP